MVYKWINVRLSDLCGFTASHYMKYQWNPVAQSSSAFACKFVQSSYAWIDSPLQFRALPDWCKTFKTAFAYLKQILGCFMVEKVQNQNTGSKHLFTFGEVCLRSEYGSITWLNPRATNQGATSIFRHLPHFQKYWAPNTSHRIFQIWAKPHGWVLWNLFGIELITLEM